jgi:outer membrane protein insertion porin family
MRPNPFFPLDLEIRVPLLGAQVQRDTRDDPIDPSRGLFGSVDLSGSGALLGSDFELVRLFAQETWFRELSLAGRPLTWAESVKIGLAHPFGGQELIRSERFFAGGPYSVRGYDLESLGPREILGTLDRAAGGEALLVINQELRFPLPWDLTGLAFFDAGQVWSTPQDADLDFAKSLGLGVRARTPLGLLRFDAAYALDPRPGADRYKLYLGFGNAF